MKYPSLIDIDYDHAKGKTQDTILTVRINIPKGTGNLSPVILQGCACGLRNELVDYSTGKKEDLLCVSK